MKFVGDTNTFWLTKDFFAGYPMTIPIITDGTVLHYLLDPDLEKHLPVIPAEVCVFSLVETHCGIKLI